MIQYCKGVIKMTEDLAIRKEQRRMLFELMEIKRSNKEENRVLDIILVRHQASMMEGDVAAVEKLFYSINP